MAERGVEFEATIELGGKTATGFAVPPDVLVRLGPSRRPAVVVAVGRYTYRTTVGSMGGRAMIPLSAEHRTAAGLAAGDVVTVTLTPDDAPRIVEVPDDLATALATAGAREAFDRLAPSHRKEHVRSVVEAKKPETRERRVAAVVAKVT